MYEVKFFGTVKQFEVDKLIDLQMLSDMIIAHIFSFQFVLIDVLGYIVSKEGVSINLTKIKIGTNCRQPKT